ncbi:tetratricopeptide repeat protein [Marinigracilibium pacificum]|uniref:Tetratricopeptide repeat protein n=1 Tax=Marinigracilibium pacificum TaxID=2729599 RepID=A0A848J6Q1_9BACT|nr:hypothetical protein [Marinigracilibium pacificum]NMM48792.1 hypothetical protein [Marinigracilibium pacificum]
MTKFLIDTKNSVTARILIFVIALAFLGVAYWCISAYIQGSDKVFPWMEMISLQKSPQSVFSFSFITNQFNILAQNFVGLTSFGSGLMTIEEEPFLYHLIIFFLGFSVILSAIPALNKYYFYIGLSLAMLILIWSEIDALMLFGSIEKYPVIASVILILGPTFFFKFRSKQTKFGRRWMVNMMTILLFILMVINFSEVERPLMLLSANLIYGDLIIFGILVLFTAHDLLTLAAYYIGGNSKSNPTYLPFVFVFILLIGNLILLYLGFHEDFQSDLILAPAILMLVGAYLGGWISWRLKLKEGELIIQWENDGKFFYLGLGLVVFGLIAFQASTAIDTLLYSINDIIIFLQIGLLFSFFLYVFINFNQFLKQGIRIGDNLYRPKIIPYVSVFVLGAVIGIGLYFLSGQLITKYAKASHQSLLGDYHYFLDERQQAEVYFRRSRFIANRNIHANMAMASLMRLRGEKVREQVFYAEAVKLAPDLKAQLNAIRLLREEGRDFEALFSATDVEKYFENDPQYWITRGAAYANVKVYDSAVWSFERAYDLGFKEKAVSNIMAVERLLNIDEDTDSLLSLTGSEIRSDLFYGNWTSLQNLKRADIGSLKYAGSDSVLNKSSFILLNNAVVNKLINLNDSIVDLEPYRYQMKNAEFIGDIEQLSIFDNYLKGNFTSALYELAGLAGSSTGSYYRFLQGMIMGDMFHPGLAADYFLRAEASGFEGSAWVGILALLENGELEEAQSIYKDAIESGSTPPEYIKDHRLLLTEGIPESPEHEAVILKSILRKNPYSNITDLIGLDSISDGVIGLLVKYEVSKGRLSRARELTSGNIPLDRVSQMVLSGKALNEAPVTVREKVYNEFYSEYLKMSSDDLEAKSLKLLYEIPIILAISSELEKRGELLKANNVMANAFNTQPSNEVLQVEYVMSCAKSGLEDYARKTFVDIEKTIPSDSAQSIRKSIDELLVKPETDWE